MVDVEKVELFDYLYQNKHLIVKNFDGNCLVHVEPFHAVLVQPFWHVLQFHDRMIHQ